ncbi:hypothetical protein WME87_11580 [Sorangium sp. So ce1389]
MAIRDGGEPETPLEAVRGIALEPAPDSVRGIEHETMIFTVEEPAVHSERGGIGRNGSKLYLGAVRRFNQAPPRAQHDFPGERVAPPEAQPAVAIARRARIRAREIERQRARKVEIRLGEGEDTVR